MNKNNPICILLISGDGKKSTIKYVIFTNQKEPGIFKSKKEALKFWNTNNKFYQQPSKQVCKAEFLNIGITNHDAAIFDKISCGEFHPLTPTNDIQL